MSQPTVASYFNTRKRAAIDNLGGAGRQKVLVLDSPSLETIGNLTNSSLNSDHEGLRFVLANTPNFTLKNVDGNGSSNGASSPDPAELGRRITRASRAIKRIGPVELDEKTKALLSSAQPKLVSFVKKGNLSPQKRSHDAPSPVKRPIVPAKKANTPQKEEASVASTATASPARSEFSPRTNAQNVEKAGPSKASVSRAPQLGKDKDSLSLGEIRSKLLNHPRLAELKTKLNKVQSTKDSLKRLEEECRQEPSAPPSPGTALKNLQKFTTFDVEVLVSPKKQLTSPTPILRTPTKNGSASPSNNVTPKRLSNLMSPIKSSSTATPVTDGSPKKLPAYQRFQALTVEGTPSLQLPYKYRSLLELFKCIDTVCAMYHNRKEQITFKKLKPAVQRMARKNFYESHLAQIHHLFPDAFLLSQEMTKNYGSATKHETYQLVIRPNVKEKPQKTPKEAEDDFLGTLKNHAMNPQVMTERYQRFHRLLLEKVQDAHQVFLLSRDPPIKIDRAQVRRWHIDFNLEQCPEIEQAELPQPPNVERFASAKDVLSTARNLFNCGTTMERALERLEEKKRQAAAAATSVASQTNGAVDTKPDVTKLAPSTEDDPPTSGNEMLASALKNVPKALLERIRAKQAAKALDQMTRRPSQDKEALKYSRLPEIARHLRNVFVTERKNVLPLETPLVKIENSYRGKLTLQELEEHIRMIAQLVPSWLTLPEVRKVKYAKVAKDFDLAKVITILERKANEAVQ
ncbi:AGAP005321-PA-like protein [Anopheles sinensis]|uniref:AGAP005321-PA-like protein n=1 Tax=Anopheles sinensis TaxID=74873 RepID=A0A084W2H5_ANOSI|nr:AGAP005321-PA-like protein [Anopheles sinensis]